MNYINQLQKDNALLNAQITEMWAIIRDFRAHLDSAKFTTNPLDNYINTNDVKNWLDSIQNVSNL